MTDIYNAIKSAIQAVSKNNVGVITRQSSLKEELGLDSMTSLTFLMTLEEILPGFSVNPDTLQMSDLQTVSTIENYILRELSEKAGK